MKKVFLSGMILLVVFLITIGCDMTESDVAEEVEWSEINWFTMSTEWSDAEGSQFSVVEGDTVGAYFIDLGWNDESDTWIMGFIEEDGYTITNNTLVGKYDNQGTESTEELDITITFSYSSSTSILTLDIVADGVLGTKTLHLTPSV